MKGIVKVLFATSVIPFFVNFIFFPFLPNEIPIHYDISGNVDRIASKSEVFIFPILIFLITIFWIFLMRFYENRMIKSDKDKEINTENILLIGYLSIGINMIYNLMNIYYLFLYTNTISNKSLNMFTGIIFAAILILSGIATKNSKRNSFFGVRTKWTLRDDYCWDKTNRLGSNLLIVSGIIICLLFSISSFNKVLVVVTTLILLVLILVLYSYYIYRKNESFIKK